MNLNIGFCFEFLKSLKGLKWGARQLTGEKVASSVLGFSKQDLAILYKRPICLIPNSRQLLCSGNRTQTRPKVALNTTIATKDIYKRVIC